MDRIVPPIVAYYLTFRILLQHNPLLQLMSDMLQTLIHHSTMPPTLSSKVLLEALILSDI